MRYAGRLSSGIVRVYGNEADVGAAIRESGVPREEIFVTSKLWNADHGRERALRACDESLGRLGTDYLDLYLIHWPVQGLRGETWEAMVQLLEQGKCRAIGVSNYMLPHLEELVRTASVLPSVNQVEQSPFLYQPELLAYCAEHGILVEAYSPLTKARRLDHPAVVEAAHQLGRTPAQVLIRWGLEHGLVVLPKSTRRERLAENAAVFDFSVPPDLLGRLDALDEGLHTGWDPTHAP